MGTLAFLGTGLLGSAFAEAAARRGDTVSAWNRSADKVQALAPFGVKAAASPADAVRGASRVHLVLKDDAVVDDVIAAALPGLAAEAILIDHSTTLPKLTAERAEKLRAQGVKYLHCPVFMGPPAARNAQGSMMVAGPEAVFESVRADLARMTGRLVYLGERTDLGAVYKLCGNTLLIGVWATLADVLALATTSGVGAEDAIKMLGLLDLNTVVSTRGTHMAKGNFAPNFELAMARKDVRLMLEALGDQPMAVLPSIAARMDQLIAAGHGREDAGVMAINALGRTATQTHQA